MDDQAFKRRQRRIQWMLTAHNTQRIRYERLSQVLTLLTFALSIVGLLFALSDGDKAVDLFVVSLSLQNLLAVVAAVTLVLSVLDMIFGWSRAAKEHGTSFQVLADLNAVYQRATSAAGSWTSAEADLETEYDRAMRQIVPLPDRAATRSKVQQNRKKELFTRSDANPSAPRALLRLQMLIDAWQDRRAHRDDTR